MKKLIITFAVFAVVFLFARLLFGYYVDVVPVFEVLLTSLTWLCVGFGMLAALFGVLLIIKEFKRK